MAVVLNPSIVLTTLAAYKSPKATDVQARSAGLVWQHQSCPPWVWCGVRGSFSWVPRFTCTWPLWCPFFVIHLYAAETWTLLFCDKKMMLEAFYMMCQCHILHVTNAEVSTRTVLPPVMDFIRRCRMSVFGHIARLTPGTPAHNALHCQVSLASSHSLGGDWRCHLLDRLRNDTGFVSANLWRQAVLWCHDGAMRWSKLAMQWWRSAC